MTKKNKKQRPQCLETATGEEVLGLGSDDDDVDAGLLTWAASLEKEYETQVSNLESDTQLTTTIDNPVDGLALHSESQGTQEDNTREVKKRKRKSHAACSLSKSANQAARASCSS